eukprot:6188513-Pleurochrysis_carterae.AAC.1
MVLHRTGNCTAFSTDQGSGDAFRIRDQYVIYMLPVESESKDFTHKLSLIGHWHGSIYSCRMTANDDRTLAVCLLHSQATLAIMKR